MGKLFGTDGVRGVANQDLTAELAFRLGQAGAYVLAGELHRTPRIIVGTDTRISCDMLFSALAAGICSMGAHVDYVGVLPTPGVAYLTRTCGADAGVVISASHNSFEFNGIKYFSRDGFKLSDEMEDRIEECIFSKDFPPRQDHGNIGRILNRSRLARDYEDFLVSMWEVDLTGISVMLDCANGSASDIAPRVFKLAGADVQAIHCLPDGYNINQECGSTHPERLSSVMRKSTCLIGFSFDGDADRLLAADEEGRIIDGDRILSGLALHMKKQGKLRHDTLVSTILSNIGLDRMVREHDIRLVRTRVGDRYVAEELFNHGYSLGGEQSGHVILADYHTTGDGILTAVKFLSMLVKEGKKASDALDFMTVYPQVTRNARVSNAGKERFSGDEVLGERIRSLEESFHGVGRVVIRPSGTEPVIRIMLEGEDPATLHKQAEEMVQLIEQRLG